MFLIYKKIFNYEVFKMYFYYGFIFFSLGMNLGFYFIVLFWKDLKKGWSKLMKCNSKMKKILFDLLIRCYLIWSCVFFVENRF